MKLFLREMFVVSAAIGKSVAAEYHIPLRYPQYTLGYAYFR